MNEARDVLGYVPPCVYNPPAYPRLKTEKIGQPILPVLSLEKEKRGRSRGGMSQDVSFQSSTGPEQLHTKQGLHGWFSVNIFRLL